MTELPERSNVGSDSGSSNEVAKSEPPVRPESIDALGALLQARQAHMTIDYLYDHGWQVGISNPGGGTYVHACDYPNKWPEDGGPSLTDTIAKAVAKAEREGWW